MTAHPATKSILGFVEVMQKAAGRGRVDRYVSRLDEHMADMSRDESLTFLRNELAKWTTRYENFQRDLFSGKPLTTTATAWDFAETIAVVSTRLARLERETEKVSVA